MVDFTRFMPPGGLPLDIKFPTPVPVGVSPPPAVQPAPVKPPRGDAIKVPIKQPPLPVKPPRAEPVKVPVKQPPLPLPGESGPIIANPGVPPIPMPPVEPQIPMPAPVPQVPAPAPVPQPAPVPIPEPPMPAPVPQVPAPVPMPAPTPEPVFSIPTPVPQPAPEPILPPPVQVPPPINLPAPPDDIVSRGTVGPVAPPPTPPVQVPPPINVPAPPDDIVSRGTVGPVAPTPQRADPPPAIFDPGPVPPPIPLAPSQPGVPTPMAPGSFEGVLPAPAEDPPATFQLDPAVRAQIEEEFAQGLPPTVGPRFTLPTFGPVGDPSVAQVQPTEEPTGIETMAPAVGFGDYFGNEVNEAMPNQEAPQDTIALPDGSTFDLSTLDIGGLTGEGFDLGSISLGGTQTATPATTTTTPTTSESAPVGAQTTGPVVATDYFHYHELIESGLSPDQIDTSNLAGFGSSRGGASEQGLNLSDFEAAGYEAETEALGFNPNTGGFGGFDPGSFGYVETGNYDPGQDAVDGFTPTADTDTNDGSTGSQNLYPFIPEGIDTSGLTDEQLQGLNAFYESGGPANINIYGTGGFPGGFPSGFPGTGTTGTTTTVTPVDMIGDLGLEENTDPGQYSPPPVPVNVSSPSSFQLTGATRAETTENPFVRPESQEGIGSLAAPNFVPVMGNPFGDVPVMGNPLGGG